MPESENKSDDQNTVAPPRMRFRYRLWIGMLLWNFGIVFTTMMTMNHLKRQPPEPLIFDFTLRRGDGGFIVYGVATGVLGLILMWIDARRRNAG